MIRLLLVCAIMVTAATGSSAGEAEPATVRVMSFNIRYNNPADGVNRWDNRKDFVAEAIQAFDPDLLGTQEVLAGQRDDLKARLPGYTVVAAGRDDGKERGEMSAVFYKTQRFEHVESGHFWLSETPEKPGSKSWDSSLPRMVTWVKLKDRQQSGAKPILFLNTHFDHRGDTARVESAKLIREKMSTLGQGSRVVLTGDFNASEGSKPYQMLFGEIEGTPSPVIDTYRTAHPKPFESEGTFSAFTAMALGSRIDWIAASRDWTVTAAAIDRTAREGRSPSDHFPVTAVLQAKPSE